MKNITEIRKKYEKAKQLVFSDYPLSDIEQGMSELLSSVDGENALQASTFEEMDLSIDLMILGIDFCRRKDDITSVFVHTLELGEYLKLIDDADFLNDNQRKTLSGKIMDFLMETRSYLQEKSTPKPKPRTPNDNCLLCHRRKATKTGSHIIPRFTVQQYFNYDGSRDRDKETVEAFNMADDTYSNFYGKAVNEDVVEQLEGRMAIPQDIRDKKDNVGLMKDYIFCEECEKRFSTIESYYAEYCRSKGKKMPHTVPYLYWMSVVWRMSATRLGIKMYSQDQEKLRRILDKSLALKREDIITDFRKLGHCAYVIAEAADTRDENLGVWGMHEYGSPYIFMIGNLFFNFFITSNRARSIFRRENKDISVINDGSRPEVIQEMPFLHFWTAKRAIFDENYKYENYYSTDTSDSVYDISRTMSVDEEKNLMEPGALAFKGQIPKGLYRMSIPRSIMKIRKYLESHPSPDKDTDTMAEIGYTPEEIAYMIEYWEAHTPLINDGADPNI